MEIKLVETSESDIPVIRGLATRIWNQHYPSIIGQQQVDYMLERMYNEASLHQQLKLGHVFLLVLFENEVIGFISFSTPGQGNFFIHKFYVLGDKQGRGVGQQVFTLWCEKYRPNEVRLTVNRQNYKSINFYFKTGFKIDRVLDIDIENGYVMNDFEMVYQSKR